jgi:hypothetical protein
MDSASPTVKRTVGRVPSVTGAKFTFFGGTVEAETLATRRRARRRASGCRNTHHRPHGEGPLV